MNTFAKYASGAALALAVAIPTASPALAGDDDQLVVVQPQAAMEEWQKDTTRDLNHALSFQPTSNRFRVDNGIVQVSFTLGADGRADNIKLYNSSSNMIGERLAKRAVRKLDTLADVPVKNKQNVKFLANMIFADNEDIKERLMAKLEKAEKTRLAGAKSEGDYILLGG
ncbi:MAG: hypothetical protein AAGL68_07080 [Pseudomonadota bacterium]